MGGSIEPSKTGELGGSGNGLNGQNHESGIVKICLITENGQFFFSSNTWQIINTLDALIPKIPSSFFCGIWVRVTSGARGSISVGFFGGGSSQRAVSTPRPPSPPPRKRKPAHPCTFFCFCLFWPAHSPARGTGHPWPPSPGRARAQCWFLPYHVRIGRGAANVVRVKTTVASVDDLPDSGPRLNRRGCCITKGSAGPDSPLPGIPPQTPPPQKLCHAVHAHWGIPCSRGSDVGC